MCLFCSRYTAFIELPSKICPPQNKVRTEIQMKYLLILQEKKTTKGVFSKESRRIQVRITQQVNNHKGLSSLWLFSLRIQKKQNGFNCNYTTQYLIEHIRYFYYKYFAIKETSTNPNLKISNQETEGISNKSWRFKK